MIGAVEVIWGIQEINNAIYNATLRLTQLKENEIHVKTFLGPCLNKNYKFLNKSSLFS